MREKGVFFPRPDRERLKQDSLSHPLKKITLQTDMWRVIKSVFHSIVKLPQVRQKKPRGSSRRGTS
jgi:hypothetical protein